MSHINPNLAAIGVFSGLSHHHNTLNDTLTRLASAKRITSVADDAAGFSVASQLGTRVDSLSQSMRNINDGIGLVQTAGAGVGQIQSNLSRMRQLAVQSANGTLNNAQRGAIQTEFNLLANEIDRIGQGTTFNAQGLLDGTVPAVVIQVGEDGSAASQVSVDLHDATAAGLGIVGASVDTQANAQSALDRIDAAIQQASQIQGDLGASQNVLEASFRVADTRHQTLAGAHSNILDADMAVEASKLAKNDLQVKAGVAAQAQANKLHNIAALLL